MSQFIALPLTGLVLLVVMMVVLWGISLRIRNAAVVDVGWGSAMVVLGLLYAVMSDGYLPRRVALAVMTTAWGLRLAGYLFFTRIWGQPEEGRYKQLREEWGSNADKKLLGFFLMQATVAVVMSVVVLVPALNGAVPSGATVVGLSVLEAAAVVVWLVGFLGEWASDNQLKRFKSDPANQGKVCTRGLWHYSRHPNYFFEWLMWVALAVFALASPWGWLGLISPIIITFFLFRVTGIPATEEQAVRSKGDAYRRYQRTTSAFFPWFPKKDTA